jgi:predicted nucleotidyltransferase
LTKDVDISLGVSLDRLADVLRVVSGLGLRVLVDPETFTRETMVLPCLDEGLKVRLDLLFSDSPYETEAVARARAVDTGGVPVRFVSPEDLIIHKVLAGRPRDLEDARSVLLRNPGMDREWIRRWLKELGALLDEPLLRRLDEIERSE